MITDQQFAELKAKVDTLERRLREFMPTAVEPVLQPLNDLRGRLDNVEQYLTTVKPKIAKLP